MKYIVCYYEEYMGAFIDAESRLFNNRKSANEYAHKLNQELAKFSECEIQDLGDYYVVRPMKGVRK